MATNIMIGAKVRHMENRHPAFAILALALLAAPLCAADDFGAPGLRVFCQALLGLGQNGTGAEGANESAAIIVPLNITLGAQHNSTLAGLMEANESVGRMRAAGLPTSRAGDLLDIGWQWFDGQTAVELSGGKPEYAFAQQKADEIKGIERGSFAVSDDLEVLAGRIGSADSDANLSATRALVDEARQEFRDGRLDEAKALINSAYEELTGAEAQAVHSRTMLESARKNIESFMAENWKTILAAAAGLLVLFFLFQKQIRRFLAGSRLKALLREREVVQSMLKALQKDYFGKKSVNDLTYHVKSKQYGDVIRNINRQLPLLKEELKRI
ncbi:MAG: hypothetical protein WC717_02035 [Candidatus Micrarchaeia archaeon]|jgi:hypothetical protein